VLPLEDITLATLIAVEVPAERILTDIACTLGLTRWLGDWPCAIKRQTYGHTNPELLRVRVPNNAHANSLT
jgi:P2-related tail formation protein